MDNAAERLELASGLLRFNSLLAWCCARANTAEIVVAVTACIKQHAAARPSDGTRRREADFSGRPVSASWHNRVGTICDYFSCMLALAGCGSPRTTMSVVVSDP